MSRPIAVDPIVDEAEGSYVARERVRLLLKTFTNEQHIQEAADTLGVSAQRFHILRCQIIQGAVTAAEPKSLGRPPAPPPDPRDLRIRELEHQLHDVKVRHEIALLREEMLAAGMGNKLKGLEKKRRLSLRIRDRP